ncbi:MAG: ATP-dependent DNA helicase RecG, partial [Candidatus Binatota bacterium]
MKDETSSFPLSGSSFNYQSSQVKPKDCLRALQTPLRFLKGVGPKRALQLEGLGLITVEDLLYHLPFRYEDRRHIKKISQAVIGEEESFAGTLIALEKRYIRKMRRQILTGTVSDGTGSLGLVWYRARPYISDSLARGQTLFVHGKVEKGMGAQKRIVHPEFEAIEPGGEEEREKILPIYFKPSGIPLGAIRRWLQQALAGYASFLPSFLPESIAGRQGLMDLAKAMEEVHRPEKTADIASINQFASSAHRSIIFDEFFYLQLGLGLRRKSRAAMPGFSFTANGKELTRRMRELLPFALTGAQERVLAEIYGDMESPRPMQRLIQGDVGSGKTVVAWLAALRAMESGFQALLMAPTELLAEQHYRNLKSFADKLTVPFALLTGSQSAKEKRETTRRIENGEISFIVGTHALIQEGVRVPRMGLGIIDEQHRFGVVQRMALQHLSDWRVSSAPSLPQPDILLMSATPIPRSLAMVLYGDMEVSSLDEMPPGRTPVLTRLFREQERAEMYRAVREELRKGHQAYLVYPLVEASELLHLRDATRMAEELAQGFFKEFPLGLVHGRMSSEEREQVMRRFKEGSLQILVATTVIEVGIDIANATVMVVEHAERFGLSQLHQLRGRVGRGKDPSQCFLAHYDAGSPDGLRRLRVMERENNGFMIAEADLALRGPGELMGTRQSGLADFRLANLARDSRLLLEARKEALAWLAEDPALTRKQSRALKEILKQRWGGRLELG